MALSAIGDIVQDVSKAADPVRLREAASRLGTAGVAPFGGAAPVDDPLGAASAKVKSLGFDAYNTLTAMRSDPVVPLYSKPQPSPVQKFEAMILAQFVEAMMPKESDAVFGKGIAGSLWKSMLSEHIGAQIAAGGGIGIAGTLEAALKKSSQKV